MPKAHFVSLAQLDKDGAITLCRHGIVHLTWRNLTIRLSVEEFGLLVRLLERGTALDSLVPVCQGRFCVALEETGYRVGLGTVELVLEADDLLGLLDLTRSAHRRLHEVMATEWPDDEPVRPAFSDAEEPLPPAFSPN